MFCCLKEEERVGNISLTEMNDKGKERKKRKKNYSKICGKLIFFSFVICHISVDFLLEKIVKYFQRTIKISK